MPHQPIRKSGKSREPLAMHSRAEADIAFVRSVVERSAHFTAVPGVGGMLMGGTAIAAAVIAHYQPSRNAWLTVWLIEAIVATSLGAVFLVLKARQRAVPLDAAPARRFAFGLTPALIAGAALTVGCLQVGAWSLLPAIWMLCYGVAVLGAGAVSAAPVVPMMGGAFVITGILSIATPASWGDYWLALSFGAGHLIAGAIVARHHGG